MTMTNTSCTQIDELWNGERSKEQSGITVSRDNNNTVRLTLASGAYDVYDSGDNGDGTYCVRVQSYSVDGQWDGSDEEGEYETEHAALVAAHESALAEWDGAVN